jgi:thiol:disulfide interchange protein DsbD
MTFIKESSEGGAWKHGLAFSIGVELSMMVLLSATFIFRSLGQAVGWGWQLQSSSVSSLLSVLFFAIAFTLLFKIEFGSSLTRLGGIGSKTTGYLNSLLLGCLTVIVATPCTGPFMGAAIGWGLSQSFFVSLLIFLSLGLGVAFPTMVLSAIPSGLNFLPKPGVWMVRVGQLMSIPMGLTAIWLAWVVQRQAGFIGLRDLFIGLFFVIIALVAYKGSADKKLYKYISIFFIILGPLFIVLFNNNTENKIRTEPSLGEVWSNEKLDVYKQTDQNILVNFTADWCLTCKVNEAVVFKSKSFNELIDKGDLIYLVADWTNYDPLITKELEKYQRGGVPLYLYWKSGEKKPKILPAILTKKIFYDEIR